MSFKALVQSKIMDFGMSSLVFTDTMGAVPPVTRTDEVTMRVGSVTSFLA